VGGKIWNCMKKKDKYPVITDANYKNLFGLEELKNCDIRKKAFEKAWETRNFEIDKFWQRSMFFWGFIALIFTGYITVVTGENAKQATDMYLDFYLILLGIIFSVAWLLVIKGSKRWQENWEKHIDYLEDKITGPLYKTIYYTKGKNYYSVSKINLILAWVIIATWLFLLIQYLCNICNIFKNLFEYICNSFEATVFFCLPLLGTVFCLVYMLTKGQSFEGKYKAKLKKEEKGAFLDIDYRNKCDSDMRDCSSYEGREKERITTQVVEEKGDEWT
jgi:hypothetical protein